MVGEAAAAGWRRQEGGGGSEAAAATMAALAPAWVACKQPVPELLGAVLESLAPLSPFTRLHMLRALLAVLPEEVCETALCAAVCWVCQPVCTTALCAAVCRLGQPA